MAAPRAQKSRHETPLFSGSSKSARQWNACHRQWLLSITSPITKMQHDNTLRRFFAYLRVRYGRETLPDKVTTEDIEEFLRQPATGGRNAGQPLSPYTRNSYTTALRSFYGYSKKYKVEFRDKMAPILRGDNPTDEVKHAKTGDVDRDMEEEEISAFFAAIPKTLTGMRDRSLFLALLITGRRRAEITRLVRGDLERVTFMENGRPRQGWLYWFKAKWRVTRESAEMPEAVIVALKELHEALGNDFETMPADMPLFPGVAGPIKRGQPITVNYVDIRFRIYARAAGLPENLCCHSFRRENAWQRYLENGHDIIKVQEDLGWRSVNQAVYYIRRRKRRLAGDLTGARVANKFSHL